MARAADRSQFDLNGPPVIGRMSVWPSTRSTQGISAGIFFSSLGERGGDLVDLRQRLRLEVGLADVEQQFRLQHEAVADDAHVRAGCR